MWMKEHKDELMDQGLLENDDELWATEKEGQWPGHAAIVALANLLKVNIAVIQGNFLCRATKFRHTLNPQDWLKVGGRSSTEKFSCFTCV